MEYEVKTIPVTKVVTNDEGVVQSLCDNCLNPDCSNPIRSRTISVFGVPRKMRLYCVQNLSLMVVECKEGYTPPVKIQEEK